MRFLCIVPIYNEERKLKNLIKKIKSSQKKIKNLSFLLINNGSSDNSLKYIRASGINFINFNKNYGVGYALIYGLKYCIKKKYKFLIHIAGNGKMLPSEIEKFRRKILYENYNFVNGSRFLPKGKFKTNPLSRIIMIKILSLMISILYFRKITDATCGYRAFEVKLFQKNIKIFDKKNLYTYGYEYYSLGKVLINKKIRFTEVPVTMKYTKKNYSKIRPVIDWVPLILGWIRARIDGKKI